MNNEQLFLLELTKGDAEDLIEALDTVVKSNGLVVAERCAQLHKLILSVRPKPVEPPKPERYVPTPEEQLTIQKMAEEKLQKELSDLIEEKPKAKKSKSSTKKKTTKKK